MKRSKAAIVLNSVLANVLCIVGYILGALIIIALILEVADVYETGVSFDAILLSVVVLAACVIAIITGTLIKRTIKRFRQYVSLISLQRLTSIPDIAARVSKSADFVRKDLHKMIGKRFFANASIDMLSDEIIVNAGALPVQGGPVEYEVFQCSGCGARGSRIKGGLGYCDYCGFPVK